MPDQPSPSVAIIGGGLAGISAACALAEVGYKVTLFERRPFLGGRASSYEHPGAGEVVDNCQHVLLGCCTNLIHLYRRFDAEDKIRWFTSLTFLEPGGRRSRIAPSMLPAPFHSAPSFLRASSLSLRDKLAVSRAMLALMRRLPEESEENFLSWLQRHGQTPGAIERFWKVVLVSAINEDLDRISVRYGAQVFRESFLKSPAAGRMGVPRVPLTELYSRGADYIRARGGEVLLRANVEKIAVHSAAPTALLRHPERSEGSLQTARHAGSATLSTIMTGSVHSGVEVTTSTTSDRFDYCILAVPYFTITKLLPQDGAGSLLGRQAEQLESSPITGIHLWFDRRITDLPHAVLLDRTIQWMFQKSELIDDRKNLGASSASPERDISARVEAGVPAREAERGSATGSYLELVVSASRSLVNMKREDIINLAVRELADFFPQAKEAALLKAAVIKEVHATYSALPLTDHLRPGTQTGWPNVFLAGDWTNTGWPATMEGAVRSGYSAAEALAGAAGAPARFRVPDLPASGLMRLFE